MSLLRFLGKRLALSLLALFGLSILIFIIARILPGDPARMALSPRAPDWAVERLREQMGFDKPIYAQYYYWISNAVRGDLGDSLYTRRAVVEDIKQFLPATVELVLFAAVIMAVLGILLGALAGRYKNTWLDNGVRSLAYVGVCTPAFVFGLMFILLFSYTLRILPTGGRMTFGMPRPSPITGLLSLDALITGNFAALGDVLKHMLLPALSLALGGMGQESRLTRASISDNLRKEYIASARGFAIPNWLVTLKFLLKPSLIPTVSILGLDIAVLFSNAFLVELVFNWPGFSKYGINAMLRKDLNALSAVVLILGAVFVIANIMVDVTVAWLDPRIRLGVEKQK